MKPSIEKIAISTVAICALVLTGLVVRREVFSGAAFRGGVQQKNVFLSDWKVISQQLTKSDLAPVRVLEFGDFECPYCAEFYKTLKAVRARFPQNIAFAYVHFPIPGHRFAIPGARVAECANEQGRFEAMYDKLFEGQDQFGLKPWDDYATAAGVPDLSAFDACVKRTDPIPRVEEGKALGAKLDVQGTPTVIINGWKLGRPPNAEELDGMVTAILAGRSPVTADGKFAK